ncbi:MAG: complex I NDUFA9 subunit family protein [Ancalomicrobiaceae bacterium]|nr:complex I NDUFA9 subunit family protein [Ancalomicrobiaceae bacterium]
MNAALNGKLATVFGGSGFLGRYVVRALAQRGWRVRAAVRRPDLAGQLQPYGAVGQIQPVQANLRPEFRSSVERAVEGADAVVNLVGILSEWGKQTFDAVQTEGASVVAEAAKAAGVASLTHVSALGAEAAGASRYARSKAAGEAAIRAAFPDAVVFRPSALFGTDDTFLNRFATLATMVPVLPLIGGGKTKFQPVYVVDVAEAIAVAIEGGATPGATYELGGPRVMSLREIFEFVLAETERRRLLVPIPFALAKLKASFLQLLPNPLLTVDQVTLLKSDSVVSEEAKAAGLTLAGLGITPHAVEAIAPSYLWTYRSRGQYDRHPA